MTSNATAVPMWRRVRKGTKDGSDCLNAQCRTLGMRTAWPSDDTGKSSVAPWSKPMNSACARDSAGFPALSLASLRRKLLYGLTKKPAGFGELAMDCLVFSPIQDRNGLGPMLCVALLQCRAHLPDGLSREKEAATGVVEDVARQLELAARPRKDGVAEVRFQALWAYDFHRV